MDGSEWLYRNVIRWMPEWAGRYRMSFTNLTTQQSHSFGGEYLELVPNALIRHTDKFEDPNLPGTMQVTVTLKAVSCGTDLSIVRKAFRRDSAGNVLPRLAGIAPRSSQISSSHEIRPVSPFLEDQALTARLGPLVQRGATGTCAGPVDRWGSACTSCGCRVGLNPSVFLCLTSG
jgi:hypothetical protein